MNRRQFLAASAASIAVGGCQREAERAASTVAAAAAGEPVLQVLLVDAGGARRFGAYLEELLGVEGVVGVQRVDPSAVSPAALGRVPAAVVYGDMLPPPWTEALEAFVGAGGTVAAVDPGRSWLERLGIVDTGERERADGIRFSGVAAGEPGLTLKVDGRRWRIAASATVEATFDSAGAGESPAVVTVARGAGSATCWAFDLPRNVALIRQGNPAWANSERDEFPLVRFVDLMTGWVRPELLHRPDADLQQRALVDGLVRGAGASAGPILALDYFPGDAPALVIATGDAHGVGADVLDQLLRRVEAGGGRMTVYYEPPLTPEWRRYARRARWSASNLPVVGAVIRSGEAPPSPHLVEAIRARGHEFAPHPTAVPDVKEGLAAALTRFEEDGYGTHHVSTRTHAIMWQDWVTNARAHQQVGIRMNLDVYQVGNVMRRRDGSWSHGHLVGSGLPARFVDENGAVIDCYQQATQIVDEQLIGVMDGPEGLSGADAARVAADQIASAVGGTPAALGWVVHFDSFVPAVGRGHEAGPFVDGVLAAAARAGVPVWPAARWLEFLDARRQTRLTARRWDAEKLRLTATIEVSPAATAGVAVLIPSACTGARLDAVTIDGAPATLRQPTRGGRAWVRCVVAPGTARLNAQYGRG